MTLDRDDGLVGAQPELAANRVDDPGVRLVRHQPIDISRAEAVGRQRLVDDAAQMLHRLAKYLAPLHAQTARHAGR